MSQWQWFIFCIFPLLLQCIIIYYLCIIVLVWSITPPSMSTTPSVQRPPPHQREPFWKLAKFLGPAQSCQKLVTMAVCSFFWHFLRKNLSKSPGIFGVMRWKEKLGFLWHLPTFFWGPLSNNPIPRIRGRFFLVTTLCPTPPPPVRTEDTGCRT